MPQLHPVIRRESLRPAPLSQAVVRRFQRLSAQARARRSGLAAAGGSEEALLDGEDDVELGRSARAAARRLGIEEEQEEPRREVLVRRMSLPDATRAMGVDDDVFVSEDDLDGLSSDEDDDDMLHGAASDAGNGNSSDEENSGETGHVSVVTDLDYNLSGSVGRRGSILVRGPPPLRKRTGGSGSDKQSVRGPRARALRLAKWRPRLPLVDVNVLVDRFLDSIEHKQGQNADSKSYLPSLAAADQVSLPLVRDVGLLALAVLVALPTTFIPLNAPHPDLVAQNVNWLIYFACIMIQVSLFVLVPPLCYTPLDAKVYLSIMPCFLIVLGSVGFFQILPMVFGYFPIALLTPLGSATVWLLGSYLVAYLFVHHTGSHNLFGGRLVNRRRHKRVRSCPAVLMSVHEPPQVAVLPALRHGSLAAPVVGSAPVPPLPLLARRHARSMTVSDDPSASPPTLIRPLPVVSEAEEELILADASVSSELPVVMEDDETRAETPRTPRAPSVHSTESMPNPHLSTHGNTALSRSATKAIAVRRFAELKAAESDAESDDDESALGEQKSKVLVNESELHKGVRVEPPPTRLRMMLILCGTSTLLGSYYSFCCAYLILFIAASESPVGQIALSLFFGTVSAVIRRFLLPMLAEYGGGTFIPSSVSLLSFFFLTLGELFSSLALPSASSVQVAVVMVILEAVLFVLGMLDTFFHRHHFSLWRVILNRPLPVVKLTMDPKALIAIRVERVYMDMLSEVASAFAFLALFPLYVFGWNSDYYPFRRSDELTAFWTSIGLVGVELVLHVGLFWFVYAPLVRRRLHLSAAQIGHRLLRVRRYAVTVVVSVVVVIKLMDTYLVEHQEVVVQEATVV